MEPTVRKDVIRRLVLVKRAQLDTAARAAASEAITRTVASLPEFQAAERVLGFVSVRSEVPTEALLRAVLGLGKTLLLPYVADDGAMRAATVSSLEELEPGYRGILEPRARLPVDPAAAGVIIVPGVAFDAGGARLGYGGGFYDAFLRSAANVPRIGICFEVQVVEEIPVLAHDERVDVVVTEARTIRCNASEVT